MYDYTPKPPVYQIVQHGGDVASVQAWIATLDPAVLQEQYRAVNLRVADTDWGPSLAWDGAEGNGEFNGWVSITADTHLYWNTQEKGWFTITSGPVEWIEKYEPVQP